MGGTSARDALLKKTGIGLNPRRMWHGNSTHWGATNQYCLDYYVFPALDTMHSSALLYINGSLKYINRTSSFRSNTYGALRATRFNTPT